MDINEKILASLLKRWSEDLHHVHRVEKGSMDALLFQYLEHTMYQIDDVLSKLNKNDQTKSSR